SLHISTDRSNFCFFPTGPSFEHKCRIDTHVVSQPFYPLRPPRVRTSQYKYPASQLEGDLGNNRRTINMLYDGLPFKIIRNTFRMQIKKHEEISRAGSGQ